MPGDLNPIVLGRPRGEPQAACCRYTSWSLSRVRLATTISLRGRPISWGRRNQQRRFFHPAKEIPRLKPDCQRWRDSSFGDGFEDARLQCTSLFPASGHINIKRTTASPCCIPRARCHVKSSLQLTKRSVRSCPRSSRRFVSRPPGW
jgi:hypothetical protein